MKKQLKTSAENNADVYDEQDSDNNIEMLSIEADLVGESDEVAEGGSVQGQPDQGRRKTKKKKLKKKNTVTSPTNEQKNLENALEKFNRQESEMASVQNPPSNSMSVLKSALNEGGVKSRKSNVELANEYDDSVDDASNQQALLKQVTKKLPTVEIEEDAFAENPLDPMGQGVQVIMTREEYMQVKADYEIAEKEQQRCGYKTRKCLSESIIGQVLCFCLRVKNKVDIPWEEMTPIQRKYRIKRLWTKARLVYHFIRMKQSASDSKNRGKIDGKMDDDGDVDLDNINSSQEQIWKWYIIRQENTLPQIWSFITNTLTVYALFATPLVLIFNELSDHLRSFELFVDICFTLDIILNFFKLSANQKESEMKQYRLQYLKSLFVVDCIACLPGLITGGNANINYFKMARFVHFNRFFDQLNMLCEKILMSWLGYTRQKVSEYVDFIKLELGVLLLTHIMAIIWIWIGNLDDPQSWVTSFVNEQREIFNNQNLRKFDFAMEIYINAFYFILTTITTVGYGDISGNTTSEYLFSMCVEFIGLTFFSFLTGTISVMFSGDQSFESLINARMEELDLWLLRLENCNKEEKIPNKLYHSIKEFIQDAFVYDFNLIIEEFSFYNELPASIQNQISESLFKTFKNQFNNFFLNTDIGFQHQLIVNMYCRIYEPGKTIISHGQKLNEMYFISKGSAVFYDQKGVTPFLQLPQFSFFGEYQLMFDLRSNFVVKVGGKEDFQKQTAKQDKTTFLCVSQDIFERLFGLFPKSKIVVQKRALERRRVFMDHLEKLENFLDEKQKKMKALQKKRMKAQKNAQALKNIFSRSKKNLGDVKNIAGMNKSDSEDEDSDSDKEQQKMKQKQSEEPDDDSDLSGNESKNAISEVKGFLQNKTEQSTVMTAFDDFESNSMDEKKYQLTERDIDPEQQAKEDYMRRLMSFRKDELVLPDESDEEEGSDCGTKRQKEQSINGVEDAYDLVESIENKMNRIANVIRGMDKRMSYNLRLMGSIMMHQPSNSQTPQAEEDQLQKEGVDQQSLKSVTSGQGENEVFKMLQKIPISERKQKVIPKIKQMADFCVNKLEMTTDEDYQRIQTVKRKLRSIDQNELKNKALKNGMGTFVVEQYFDNNQDQRNGSMEK